MGGGPLYPSAVELHSGQCGNERFAMPQAIRVRTLLPVSFRYRREFLQDASQASQLDRGRRSARSSPTSHPWDVEVGPVRAAFCLTPARKDQ